MISNGAGRLKQKVIKNKLGKLEPERGVLSLKYAKFNTWLKTKWHLS